jgi:hypothetical protein
MWKFADLKALIYRYECVENCLNFKAKELQLINLMRSILTNLKKLTLNLIEFGERYSTKDLFDLRERQRSNLKRFCMLLKCVDLFFNMSNSFFIFVINYCLIKIEINNYIQIEQIEPIKQINSISFYDTEQQQQQQQQQGFKSRQGNKFEQLIKFLKQYLQLVQNLNTQSESNRWHECQQLLVNNNKFDLHDRLKSIMQNVFYVYLE